MISDRQKMRSVIVFASSNRGKVEEARGVAQRFNFALIAPGDLTPGSEPPQRIAQLEVEELGLSYLENAGLKADAYFAHLGLPALGDDSGLEINALNAAPGLLSARFAGDSADMVANRAKVLSLMRDKKDRTALFRCVLMLRVNHSCVISTEDTLTGSISHEERGEGGFGYDSIIEIDGYGGRTLAELKQQHILVNTHRLKALHALFMRARQLPPDVWPRRAR